MKIQEKEKGGVETYFRRDGGVGGVNTRSIRLQKGDIDQDVTHKIKSNV